VSVQGVIREEIRQLLEGALGPLIERLEALEKRLEDPETQVGSPARSDVPAPEPWPQEADGADDVADLAPEKVSRAAVTPRKRAPRKTAGTE
jgi:hypothetical protein